MRHDEDTAQDKNARASISTGSRKLLEALCKTYPSIQEHVNRQWDKEAGHI